MTFVTDSLGNPSGGNEKGFTTANNVGLDLNFDLEKLCGLEGGSFLLSMSYRFGGSLSASYIHNVFTVQQVFGGETFHFINMLHWMVRRCPVIPAPFTGVSREPTASILFTS